jgi:hypothetical protein
MSASFSSPNSTARELTFVADPRRKAKKKQTKGERTVGKPVTPAKRLASKKRRIPKRISAKKKPTPKKAAVKLKTAVKKTIGRSAGSVPAKAGSAEKTER